MHVTTYRSYYDLPAAEIRVDYLNVDNRKATLNVQYLYLRMRNVLQTVHYFLLTESTTWRN